MLCYYFDVLDGALARVMGATSDIGATLDDVADFVCHGAAPVALLVCINAPRQDVTFFSKVAESSWTVLLLCGAIVALSLCRTVHVYATKSVQPTGTFYHGLPTTYVGPSIAAMYVLTGSSTAATLAAVGLTVALLPTMDRPAEGMMESQNWKRWSFLAALLVSLVNMRLGALCTLVLVSLYAFVPSIFLWDQSKPTRLFGGSQQGSLLQRFLINRQNAY
jgi:phosphatidylserine synthase